MAVFNRVSADVLIPLGVIQNAKCVHNDNELFIALQVSDADYGNCKVSTV